MKPIPIKLDRLMANTSIEPIRGKLVLVAADQTRIILEFKNKKVQTIMGPFDKADLDSMLQKEVVVFVKPGEKVAVYDAKGHLREKNKSAKAAGEGGTSTRATRAKAEPARKGPSAKWAKYAEGRMVGEPVKLLSIQKGFGMEPEFVDSLLEHLEIAVAPNTKAIAYLDFRKLYQFICSPEFSAFKEKA